LAGFGLDVAGLIWLSLWRSTLLLRKASITVVTVWLLAFACGGAHADDNTSLRIDVASVDSSAFPELSAVVDVLDANGRPVSGLDAASFAATVDGSPARVDSLQPVIDSQVGLSVILAVDVSGSMDGRPLEAAQKAAGDFVSGLAPQDSAVVLTFGDSINIVQESTTDKAAVVAALSRLEAGGNTALFDATSKAVASAAQSPSARRAVILLSDGVDYGDKSSVSRDESLAQARASGVPIFAIGLGADVDKAYLNELAQATGAHYLETPTPEGLSQLYADIASVLRGQYVVKLTSPATDPSSSHALQLSVSVAGVIAVTTKDIPAARGDGSPQVVLRGLESGGDIASATTVTVDVAGSGPFEVRFSVDGKPLSVVTATPYIVSIDPAVMKGGNHSLHVEVKDASGRGGSLDATFTVAGGSAAGVSKMPLLATLVALIAALGGAYLWKRRRPRVGRQVVQVRLRPWSNGGAGSSGVSAADEEPILLTPDIVEEEPLAKLIIVGGPDAGREFPVGTTPLSIGSAEWCDVAFPDEEGMIGAEEARAWVHQDKLMFHKLTRLSLLASDGVTGGWLILENGDEVAVGRHRLRFEALPSGQAVHSAVKQAVEQLDSDSAEGATSVQPAPPRLRPIDSFAPDMHGEEDSEPPAAASSA
jgi:VWFA-related protein